MDTFELYNNQRDLALKIIEEEIKSFNDRIERTRLNLHKEVIYHEWTWREFQYCMNDITRLLNKILNYNTECKMNKDIYIDDSTAKFQICECKFYLGGQYLTSYAIKNYVF